MKTRNAFLPKDVKNVIIAPDNTVIVNLTDGKKGIAKCGKEDAFDSLTGFMYAYYRANHTQAYKLKQALDCCIASAKKRGYTNSILKNC